MTGLLKRMKNSIKKNKNKINSSLIYKVSKQSIKINQLNKELKKAKANSLIKERKFIDKISIQKYEIRYIDLQMARITKYINSYMFQNSTNQEIREHLIKLIKGNTLDWNTTIKHLKKKTNCMKNTKISFIKY